MRLAQNHTAECRVVIAETHNEAVRYAADELARCLFKMCGASFPIASDLLALRQNDILLGENRHTEALGLTARIEALPKEGFFY